MNKYELSTSMLDVISFSLYNSPYSSQYLIDDYVENYPEDDDSGNEISQDEIYEYSDRLSDNFDDDLFEKFLCEKYESLFNKYINPMLIDNGINIYKFEAVGIHSPKSYNYSSDSINYNMYIDKTPKQLIVDIVSKYDINDFFEYMKNTHKSRDGYVSFVPRDLNEFIETYTKESPDQAVSIILHYIYTKELDFDELSETYMYDVMENFEIFNFQKSADVDITEKVLSFSKWTKLL